MQSSNESNLLDIIDLANLLRQEQLFIINEQESFKKLNTELISNSENIAQLAWICSQQRQNLKNLIVSKPDTGPSSCCRRSNNLENIKFIPAYKAKELKYQYILAYTDLFNYLYRSPYLLAQCLSIGDTDIRSTPDNINMVVETIANGLYGNVVHSNDVQMVLKILQELIEIQNIDSNNPRRMFRTGSCAFSRLYHILIENLFSAKLFLTAALYDPIMKVLIEDETILDIDPAKIISNIPVKERQIRFGQIGTPEYEEKVRKYTEKTHELLLKLANRFVKSLSLNWSLFPSTLRWLVQSEWHYLKRSHVSEKDINSIITDMIFTSFICPAVVSPDIYGITDAPISENARLNLIQIGQILQMLALIKYENICPKFMDLYKKFDCNSMGDLIEQLYPNEHNSISMLAMSEQPSKNIGRRNILVTQNELVVFVSFLRNVLDSDNASTVISDEDRRKLNKILERTPEKTITNGTATSTNPPTTKNNDNNTKENGKAGSHNSTHSKKGRSKLGKSLTSIPATQEGFEGLPLFNGDYLSNNNNHSSNGSYDENDPVLSIPISICDDSNFQLLTEDEVLNLNSISNDTDEQILSEKNVEELESRNEENPTIDGVVLRSAHQKHTRFSLSRDDASIGNTSDNLEAVSEAPSNHSVASSMELEENYQNDNLSDMVSANVSGRGTPNISGRDTPSSQVTESDARPSQIPTPQMAKILNKTRSDIEEKFCKFEIKKLMEGDETISIISDTWSTDVLASDSETIEANDRDRHFSTPLIPSAVILPGDNNFDPLSTAGSQLRSQNFDLSETHSESAWSTDVLASDSEKMTEIDIDDNQSLAKSDITDAGRSETGSHMSHRNNAADLPMIFGPPRIPNNNYRTPDVTIHHRHQGRRTSDNTYCGAMSRGFDDHPMPNEDYPRSRDLIDVNESNSPNNCNLFQYNLLNRSALRDNDYERLGFLTPPNVPSSLISKRQNSIESNTSEISSNYDRDDIHSSKKNNFDYRRQTEEYVDNTSVVNEYKLYDEQNNNQFCYNDTYDQKSENINNDIIKTSTTLNNPFDDVLNLQPNIPDELIPNDDLMSDELVEHRRISSVHRNASFDGRRNGMIERNKPSTSMPLPLVSPNVNNYENHHILPHPATKSSKELASAAQTEEELLLIKKTMSLNLANSGQSQSTPNGKNTGAIPKSISFDSSADKITEKNSNYYNNHTTYHIHKRTDPIRAHSSSFFNKIKQGFKNRRGHKFRSFHDRDVNNEISIQSSTMMSRNTTDNNDLVLLDNQFNDTTEDILAKYRRKASSSSDAAASSDSTSSNASSSKSNKSSSETDQQQQLISSSDTLYLFKNAKRKLRIVLSSTNLQSTDFHHYCYSVASPLVIFLQLQLAQALNLQNLQQVSYVSETIRCINTMELHEHQKLLDELQQDIFKRQTYIQYLIRYRQSLLAALENLDRFKYRLQNDREMCNRHLIMVCVRMFLEKREQTILKFIDKFTTLTVVDEKIDYLDECMRQLMDELKSDGILQGMADWQLQEARSSIERILLQRVYRQVMFPNNDGDIHRDQLLREHIRKLSKQITPSHSNLRIPQEYLLEAPWPFAQQQISSISAYKTPKEKVQCVVRCVKSIMNLLSMASHRVPSADDLTPVLIYVIIKANPPYLLSTIEYVNSFIGDKLEGEAQYWWTQFCSAVAFIKTM